MIVGRGTRRRTRKGSPPGHPIESATADIAGTSFVWRRYNAAVLDERTAGSVEEVLNELDPACVYWLHFPEPPPAAGLRWLHDRLGLDPLALEDVHNAHQRTKVERYDNHTFMTISVPVLRQQVLSLEQFSLFLGPHWVLSFWGGDGELVEPIAHRLRNGGNGRIRKRGADYLFYCLLDAAVDSCFPVLEALHDRLEELEEDVLGQVAGSAVGGVHELRRQLALMRRLVLPATDALQHLLSSDESPLSAATRRYVRDVLDHQRRIDDMVEHLIESTRSLHELHLMSVSHRMNDVMRLLTIIATIFIPLTFIAGIYGMNFDPDASPWNMPELRARYGYPLVMLLFAAIGLGMAWMFRRRGWF